MEPTKLLALWASHIKNVYAHRGRCDVYSPMSGDPNNPKNYIPLEVFHTCHGCGAGGISLLYEGLCPRCYGALQDALKEPTQGGLS